MVTTGNNRNSASLSLSLAKPSPLFLSLSLSRLSLHLHSPFSIPLRLSSLLFSPLLSSSFSSSYLFFSSFLPLSPLSSLSLPPLSLSLSIRGIYHCPVRLIVLPRSWSVPGRKRLDRLFFFFPSFSFPISSSLPPSLSSINQVKVQFQLGFVSITFTFFLARTRPGNSLVFRRPVNLFRPSFLRSALAPSPFPHFAGLIHSGFLSCMSG